MLTHTHKTRLLLSGLSGLVIVVLLIAVSLYVETSQYAFQSLLNTSLFALKWYYVALVSFILLFVLWLGLGRYKNVRIGRDYEAPEYRWLSWFSMLFAAGMGIGLIFWSVSEPLTHFMGNPFVEAARTPEAANTAIRLTFFHWGLHAWAIYALVGLCLGYFAYRRGMPLTIRSVLYPLFGRHIYGAIGHVVDVFAVLGTAFGVATSLGLGVQQIASGIGLLAGVEVNIKAQITILALVTLSATISAVTGVRRGIRILSNTNLVLSVIVLLYFIALGPTKHLLGTFIQGIGDYVQNLIGLSTWLDVNEHTLWQESWTIFYWAWWLAWSPFVGMFIAKISRGRTIREFVMGVLLVPAIFTFTWLAFTGGTGLYIELFNNGGLIGILDKDITLPLFYTIKTLSPGLLGDAMIIMVVILTAVYFVTSCDSGTLVITTILSEGDEEPPIAQRVIWGIGEGVIAAVLLSFGGLVALQSATIAAALPFSIVVLIMIFGLLKALREEPQAPREGTRTVGNCEPWTGCRIER